MAAIKQCKWCGNRFEPKYHAFEKFCSKKCKNEHEKSKGGGNDTLSNIISPSVSEGDAKLEEVKLFEVQNQLGALKTEYYK